LCFVHAFAARKDKGYKCNSCQGFLDRSHIYCFSKKQLYAVLSSQTLYHNSLNQSYYIDYEAQISKEIINIPTLFLLLSLTIYLVKLYDSRTFQPSGKEGTG
jgi:hypothetical protein